MSPYSILHVATYLNFIFVLDDGNPHM